MTCMKAIMDCPYHDKNIYPLNTLLTQQNSGKNFDEEGSCFMGTACSLTDAKLSNPRSLIQLLVSNVLYESYRCQETLGN